MPKRVAVELVVREESYIEALAKELYLEEEGRSPVWSWDKTTWEVKEFYRNVAKRIHTNVMNQVSKEKEGR